MQAVQNVSVVAQNTVENSTLSDLQIPNSSHEMKTSRAWSSTMRSLPKNALHSLTKIKILPSILFDLCKKIYEYAIALLCVKKPIKSDSPSPEINLNDDQIFTAVFQLSFNEWTDLSASEIRKHIREQPEKLKECKYFNLENMNLNRLPPEIANCTHLEDISLSQNKFKEIPSVTYTFSSTLLDFKISENLIKTIPSQIEVFEKLEMLDISRNAIEKLPREIGNLTNLTVLHAEVNKLRELPDVFYSLQNLERLYIEENELEFLPPSIGKAAALTEINCTRNKLVEIPKTIDEIKTLISLNLSNNKIKELIPLNGCERLNYLNMSKNKLKSIPPELFEGLNLLSISLAHNQIESLPELREFCPVVVMALDLSYNQFKTFPTTLCRLKNLKSLILDKNQIDAWQSELIMLKKTIPKLVVREPTPTVEADASETWKASLADLGVAGTDEE